MYLPTDPYANDPWSWAFVLFRPVPEHPGSGVDTGGNLWSCRPLSGRGPNADRWRPLNPTFRDGYAYYRLGHPTGADANKAHRSGHEIVLSTFIGPAPPGCEGCHFNGARSDNRLRNLRWDTKKANSADSIRHGTRPTGERHRRAKLSDAQAIEVKRLIGVGVGNRAIAGRLEISESIVCHIRNGRRSVPATQEAVAEETA